MRKTFILINEDFTSVCDCPIRTRFLHVNWLGQRACAILIMKLHNFYFNPLLKIFFGYFMVISRESFPILRWETRSVQSSSDDEKLSDLLEKAVDLSPVASYFLDATLKYP